jgi:hypothetical protein
MATSLRTVSQLRAQVMLDPKLRADLSTDPETTLARLDIVPVPDTWIYRIVVGSLGLVVLSSVIGAIVLSAVGKPIPELLLALGSAAIGALAGLLAPSPANSA